MKIHIIATRTSQDFVAKIRPALKGAVVTYSCSEEPFNLGDNIERLRGEYIKAADIILVVVDESFWGDKDVNDELGFVLQHSNFVECKTLVPIILDDNRVPDELKGIVCAKCHSDSDEDIRRLSNQLREMSELKKVMAKKATVVMGTTIEKKDELRKPFYKNTISLGGMIAILSIVIVLFSIIFFIFGDDFVTMQATMNITVGLAGIISVCISMARRRKFNEKKEETEQYFQKLRDTIIRGDSLPKVDSQNIVIHNYHPDSQDSVEPDEVQSALQIDALGRMLINLEDIKEFYTWSQRQAKGSFKLAVSMCIAGFVMMAVAILLPIAFGLSVEMAIIPAIGGAIAEVVAGTALIVYKSSLAQLNHYHKALHEDERFLSSVNLISRFSTTEIQDEMLREIVRSEIQMNLISIAIQEDTAHEKSSYSFRKRSKGNKLDN